MAHLFQTILGYECSRPGQPVSLMGRMENDEKRNNHFNQVKHNSIFFFLILRSANRAYTPICRPRKEFLMFTGRNITAEQKAEEEEGESHSLACFWLFPINFANFMM